MPELCAFSRKLERLRQLYLVLFQIYKLYTTYEARFATVLQRMISISQTADDVLKDKGVTYNVHPTKLVLIGYTVSMLERVREAL